MRWVTVGAPSGFILVFLAAACGGKQIDFRGPSGDGGGGNTAGSSGMGPIEDPLDADLTPCEMTNLQVTALFKQFCTACHMPPGDPGAPFHNLLDFEALKLTFSRVVYGGRSPLGSSLPVTQKGLGFINASRSLATCPIRSPMRRFRDPA